MGIRSRLASAWNVFVNNDSHSLTTRFKRYTTRLHSMYLTHRSDTYALIKMAGTIQSSHPSSMNAYR